MKSVNRGSKVKTKRVKKQEVKCKFSACLRNFFFAEESHIHRLSLVFAVVLRVLHNVAVLPVMGKIIFRVCPRALVQDISSRLIIFHDPEHETRKEGEQEHRHPQIWAKSIAQREATPPHGVSAGHVIFVNCMMTRHYDHSRVEPRR